MKQNENMNEEEVKGQQASTQEETAGNPSDGEQKEEAAEKEMTAEDKLAAAESKIAELQDKYLRQVAEFDNYRKRTIKEKADLILNGS